MSGAAYTTVNTAVDGSLNFGNVRDGPPVCPPPTFGTNAQGVPYMQITVQDSDSGLASIVITYAKNITVDIAGFFLGTKLPVVVTGTAIDPLAHIGLTFVATDLAGNQTTCDPGSRSSSPASLPARSGRSTSLRRCCPEATTSSRSPATEVVATVVRW